MNKPVLILGSGALACFYANRIASAGYEVGMLSGWDEAIEKISKDGVSVVDTFDRMSTRQVRISSRAEDFQGTETAFVLVKSWQTHQAAKQLRSCLAHNGVCLTLQNGLGNEKLLADYLGGSRVSAGTTVIGARLLEAGVVKVTGIGRINLEDSPKLRKILRILEDAKLEVRISENVSALQWEKLVVNAAINPITMLMECRNGALLDSQETLDLVTMLVDETCRVAASQNIRLSYDNPLKYVLEIIKQTSSNFSSMLQDYYRRAPTEIDSINGSVIRYAEAAGVPVPYNKMALKMVKARLALKSLEEDEELDNEEIR